jgi:hypothetical protein
MSDLFSGLVAHQDHQLEVQFVNSHIVDLWCGQCGIKITTVVEPTWLAMLT